MRGDTGLEFIRPDWAAPDHVKACFTTRRGGRSSNRWNGFNLADHVGDDPRAVAKNRALLRAATGLKQDPCWLHQVHGAAVHRFEHVERAITADAAITRQRGVPCVIMVADCVPLLLSTRDGSEVAAVHVGWRGLANNIIACAVKSFANRADELIAWTGPCIGTDAYVVGAELREHFVAEDPESEACFVARDGGWHMDLRRLAKQQLNSIGVAAVTSNRQCVYSAHDSFFSFRRDGETGRMAAIIWID